jgi:DNA-binding response OmpR family regulator
MKPLSVLLIEEDPSVRQLLCEFLSEMGCTWQALGRITSLSEEEFRRSVEGCQPSAVICDVQLTLAGGQKVIQWLQDLPQRPRFFFLVTMLMKLVVREPQLFAEHHLLEKPFSLKELEALLRLEQRQ